MKPSWPVVYGSAIRRVTVFRHSLSRSQRKPEIAMSTYPVTDRCPHCGAAAYVKVKPETPHFTGQWDRLCTACGTRYTPPIPAWAALVLIALGVGVILGSYYVTFVALTGPYDTQDLKTKVVRYVGTVAFILFGLGLIGVGIWQLLPRKDRKATHDEQRQGPDDNAGP
jgi:hypothetical protein